MFSLLAWLSKATLITAVALLCVDAAQLNERRRLTKDLAIIWNSRAITQEKTNRAVRNRRRIRRRAKSTAIAESAMVGNASTHSFDMSGTQTDLSGTYTGTVNYPEGGITGPATVTITGNNFTLTPDGGGAPISGRVTAVTTRGYIGVTMMFGDTTPPPVTMSTPPLPAVSLRARLVGGHVTLVSVPGEKREFSFSSGSGGGSPPLHTCLTLSKPVGFNHSETLSFNTVIGIKKRQQYNLRGIAGQMLRIKLDSNDDNGLFSLIDMTVIKIIRQGKEWSGSLPSTGKYVIEIGNCNGSSDIRYRLTITLSPF